MQLALILLVCTVGVFCTPEKRVLLDSFASFDTTHLKQTVQTLLNTLGTDTTEQLCETECHTLLTDQASVLHYSCGLICHGFQSLVNKFHLVPQTATVG
ncbi:hypothetical protein CHS0354_030951 [Potamilus streckersoni]|uniref:Uncharacterized protein n=1 Tax=Potamilus streckersoni TaxID=2493646 RepID=A0AAE0VL69_9BIVA|nr:hypothetical protein CHS0354_030951 [Potamilus streckersoni]